MSIQSNFPSIKPTLLLDFANTKALDPRITFTRASTATYFDQFGVMQTAAAGVARFDHNPTTYESLGLLIEEQRTNLLTYSQQFDNAAWSKSNSSIQVNTVVAPDGTLTADKLVENTASARHELQLVTSLSVTLNAPYSLSAYLKYAGRQFVSFARSGYNPESVCFDLVNGTVTATGANATATITPVGNGWYRCSMVTAVGDVSYNPYICLRTTSGVSVQTYTGDGSSGVYIWGAQLEAGAFPTSYIKTEASQVTRSADAASMTGTNFSSWYNQAEGTIYCEAAVNGLVGPAVNQTSLSISYTNSYNDSYVLFLKQSSSNYRAVITNVGGATKYYAPVASVVQGVFYKQAFSYQTGSMVYVDSGSVVSPTSSDTTLIQATRLTLGAYGGGASPLNGTIKKVAYYPIRVTNAQDQGLTS